MNFRAYLRPRFPLKLRLLVLFWFFTLSFLFQTLPPARPVEAAPGIAPPEFFGVVGRDPWYEWNSDPVNFKNQPNRAFLENMAREIRSLGARWVRIEFHADQRPGFRGGYIDYAKYDDFINNIAPRYGLKILGLIAADAIVAKNADDGDLVYVNINQPPDRPDGSNNYTRFFATRTREIISHYGDKIAAYELLNEQNLWYGITARPESVAALLVYTYTLAKPVQPKVKLLMGGIIFTPNLPLNSAEYLSQIYKSGPVQAFVKNGTHYDGNPFPFDGVAWHPYSPKALTSVQSVRDAINIMRASGDATNKIWVTETSVEGRPNLPGVCGVSPGEQYQADYLQEFFTQMVYAFQGDVAAVFWFKYEDFSDSSGYQPWGLVRLEADNQNRYMPGGKVAYYKAAYRAYLSISGPPSPVDRAEPPATINLTNNLYFPETGHHLTGSFLRYWQATGGLAVFGFPITEPFEEKNLNDGKTYTVQYFERERFELHPEAKGTAYEVQLGLLGSNLLTINCRSFSRAAPSAEPNNPNRTYIPQTGHYLSGNFKRYWEQNGGLAIFGYPLSEEFGEQNPSDGKTYIVQWFERARFEYHPEAAGTRNEVQLGLLGSQWLKWRGWMR